MDLDGRNLHFQDMFLSKSFCQSFHVNGFVFESLLRRAPCGLLSVNEENNPIYSQRLRSAEVWRKFSIVIESFDAKENSVSQQPTNLVENNSVNHSAIECDLLSPQRVRIVESDYWLWRCRFQAFRYTGIAEFQRSLGAFPAEPPQSLRRVSEEPRRSVMTSTKIL